MNPFATHLQVVQACLEHTDGAVLEMGSGWFSTPMLSAYATDRLVRTVEADPHWFLRVSQLGVCQPLTSHRHQFVFVTNYDAAPIFDHFWDVVLLDHEPPARRGIDAIRLRTKCRLMIGHDSQHPDYGYEEAFGQFRYRFTDSRRIPWTTVVSDWPLDWLEASMRMAEATP